jgi:antitoxin (DNA-binding transcriptional repressor) of toxin-antitoxin stability system
MRVSIKYAKIHLAKLITRALRGEEIIICRGSKPLVRLEPVTPPQPARKTPSR